MYREIDLNTYARRAHFDYFRGLANPYVGVTVNVDITDFRRWQQARGLPFFLSFLYVAGRAVNDVPELRQRMTAAGGIVEYDFCRTSHTVSRPDGTYAYCELDARLPLPEFLEIGDEAQRRAAAEGGIDDGAEARELIFVSCVPWLSYVSLVQPTPIPADSNPRLTWGRFCEQDGRTLLPVSLLANHALVDGLQLARFYERLEAWMDSVRAR